ncbi:serine/threonine-protein kinase [Streptomyces sp. B8F3]|uniref:serine/threonine-protein kinase n=1 Tax=Streptomyces sp. B8F3 TaxID=3153573 RepID=UPI00325E2FFE
MGDPREVGGYLIEGKLGAGGMGRVYRGRSPGGRVVAVKVARADLAADPGFRARFRSEVEAARRVGGFHTAQVVDADPDADPPWMVTAYIPGRPLDQVIAEDGPLDTGALQALGAALAEALQAVHACGLVHRDLKPSNIIMSEDGPRVLDFGIARALEETRLTATDQVIGTPGYLAPEQVTGEEVGPACDLFALGAVLVYAAGGRAFGRGAPMSLMYRVAHHDADVSALPESMRAIVARCLHRDAQARITTGELLAALNTTTRSHPTPTAHGGTAPPPPAHGAGDPVHAPTELDTAAGHQPPAPDEEKAVASAGFQPFWFAVPERRALAGEDGETLSPAEELPPGAWYLAIGKAGDALLLLTATGHRRLLTNPADIEIGISTGQTPDPDFKPFWFAVPEHRALAGEDGETLSPAEELPPGAWYLATGKAGDALLVRTSDGHRRLLLDARGIQRG